MTEDDKMFEKLGYEKIIDQTDYISFFNDRNATEIDFDINREVVQISTVGVEDSVGRIRTNLTMQELKAITKKCEELGWLEKEYSYELDYWDEKSREEKLNND